MMANTTGARSFLWFLPCDRVTVVVLLTGTAAGREVEVAREFEAAKVVVLAWAGVGVIGRGGRGQA